MIKISVIYPNTPGARFDHEYYRDKHMPMLAARMGAACKRYTVEKGLSGGGSAVPAPYVAMCHIFADSVEAFQAAFGPHAKEIMKDVPNYTDLRPVMQISEVVVAIEGQHPSKTESNEPTCTDQTAHQLTMTVLMTPDMANFAGNVHGGTILKLLDQVAYACAARYSGCYVVTLSVDQVMFRQPIYVGELVTFLASINYSGTSSMEVGVKVVAEDIRTQTVRHVNSCFFTMVAVDDERKPVTVPPLRPTTAIEHRRFAAARLRRQVRSEMEQRFASLNAEPTL